MELTAVKLQGPEDNEFINEFVSMPARVRAPQFHVGLNTPEHTKLLMMWGLSQGSSFWLFKDSEGIPQIRMSARKSPHIEGHGTIGFFEINLKDPEALAEFSKAVNHVVNWLKEQGANQIVAPIDINTWFNYRFSLPGKKFFPRHSWEPTNPPEYLELFRKEGFKNFAHYQSMYFPYYKIGPIYLGDSYLKKGLKSLHAQGFTLRPFDKENFLTKEVPLFYEISHEAFSDALMFEPIDRETFTQLYAAAKDYDSSPSCVMISPDGEVAGFLFAFYDGDYLVIKSLAIRKKYQGLRLSSGMIYSAVKQSFSKNTKATISALFKTGIASEKISNNSKPLWFSWGHDYVLLKKDLTHE